MSKSIAGYTIFPAVSDFQRMKDVLLYYSFVTQLPKFSYFLTLERVKEVGFNAALDEFVDKNDRYVQIIAYCLMPTHIHIILKQLRNQGVVTFMSNTLNSYSKFFNRKHKRQGPLWMGRFKNVRIDNDEQLLHVTRYVHLNPVVANIVEKTEDWSYSSYKHYTLDDNDPLIPEFSDILDISPTQYKSFVEDGVSYQKEMHLIKQLILDQ